MKFILLPVVTACLWLSLISASADAAEPQVLRAVCEASAVQLIPCVGATGAPRCALVGDNEEAEHLFRYRVTPEGALVPVEPEKLGKLKTGVEISDIEALTMSANEIVAVGSHSRKKDGERAKKRLRVAVLALGADDLAPGHTLFEPSESAWAEKLKKCDKALIVQPKKERSDKVRRLVSEVCGAITAAEARADESALTKDDKEARVAQTFNIEGAVFLPDGHGQMRLWVGLRAPLLAVEGGGSTPKAILLRLASLATSADGVRFDGVAAIALGGKGIRDLTLSQEKLWGIAGDVADSSNDNRLWHVAASEIRNGARLEHVTFEEPPLPSTAEGLAIDASSARAFVVIDGDAKDCDKNPARQMTIGLR